MLTNRGRFLPWAGPAPNERRGLGFWLVGALTGGKRAWFGRQTLWLASQKSFEVPSAHARSSEA